jgi:hypothetical protein
MAALAQAAPQQQAIRDVLSSVRLPLGVALQSIEFRENSHGEPSWFITYAVAPSRLSDAQRAKELSGLIDQTLRALDRLNLPFFEYVDFVVA